MKNLPQAKQRLLFNVGTNIIQVILTAGIGVWFIPYLIGHLGLGVYGVVPLISSVTHYFGLATLAISGAVSRFVVIYHEKNEIEKSNEYFNTAFFSLIALCGVLLIPAVILSLYSYRIFNVPSGYENDTMWLFLAVLLSSFLNILVSPFQVSPFMQHRFDLINLAKIISKITQVLMVVSCFIILKPSLRYVGTSYFSMSSVMLLMMVVFCKKLSPELRLSLQLFRWKALKDMLGMGLWTVINELGALLYLSSDILIINLMLGSTQVGRYAPIVQWVMLLTMLSGTVSSVFVPIAYEYIGNGDLRGLAIQNKRIMKYMGYCMALPAGGLCVFSKPLLQLWLGEEFAGLSVLMWLLVMPSLIGFIVSPLFSTNRGLNKVRVPALVTLAGGVLNVIISASLVYLTPLGIYGVAVGTIVTRGGKNLLFDTVYTARILGLPSNLFMPSLVPGTLMFAVTVLLGWLLQQFWQIDTWAGLMIAAFLIAMTYAWVCYRVSMNSEDRQFVKSLIKRRL